MDLSLCCDLRIAAQSARFKAGYTSMAYSPDAGASWHLPRLIGTEQAKRLLFLDELWGAERALAAGLVGEVVADEQLPRPPPNWPRAWPRARPSPMPRPSA
jgi:2-(1,2-epoxy-1,2-dihydrophenyl)acetyl-CoA isomerase